MPSRFTQIRQAKQRCGESRGDFSRLDEQTKGRRVRRPKGARHAAHSEKRNRFRD